MRFLFYTHSLASDWNHGNAHFLRGVMRALQARGHETTALEPADGWSRENLLADRGPGALDAFARSFPDLDSRTYGPDFVHEAALDDADVEVVHEWTEPALVARIGRARRAGGRFLLLFHDTHHRAISAGQQIAGLDLDGFDGVLAFGESLREHYLSAGWGRQVFTWHEAADTSVFRPLDVGPESGDLVWIGNWGDGERTRELETFLIAPCERLRLRARIHGVRYPAEALARLRGAGIDYAGSIANTDVPVAFARHRVTVHVPRRPYVRHLPGIPTIRPFEALACGIPLVSAPWQDAEGLFRPGDFRVARDGNEMCGHLTELLRDPEAAAAQARAGRETVLARHTCGHRADELLAIVGRLGLAGSRQKEAAT
ncbi:glycosyltransferase [Rhodobacteraceae bacterium 2CG4]|uniref:Glycosyltransferase n=1 Tax=Halovulum marinum TaxID=2662447 RepID=A0A6L5YY17_9RHOB|nr:glycosyltransferase [Halovulum marinum]MSU89211.1 glycosyltransferase [Halovulum marinum]